MKIKRIKVKEMVSAGVGQVLPANPVRPDVSFEWHEQGVLILNGRTGETMLTPWQNVVEIVIEEPEEEEAPKKRGRPKKSEL
jgi:hypothetical protein